jgi:hypothetical protein
VPNTREGACHSLNVRYPWGPKPNVAPIPVVRRTVGNRLAAAWHTGFGQDPGLVDVAAIKARVDRWTARHVANHHGMFASFDPPEPYHVVREGDRLAVTAPRSRVLRSESWRFSPGQAELITSTVLFARQRHLQVFTYAIERIWIVHRVWTNGRGASDALKIRSPGYGAQVVVALDYNFVHNILRPPGRRFGWSVSPTLEGVDGDHGTPQGIREDLQAVAPVAPTILALCSLIAETTERPVSAHVEFVRRPIYTDGPGD